MIKAKNMAQLYADYS